ncbi:hypothetical protein B296_00026404 [Ensete ventricosum]|uniref:Uncharacterized protein n=1 Tax=Ensete ventricosum TaxID=4639 RepID=A0A426XK06_ENSVE|nr:hypothetical protein B296_00026404 [Ensete ventricosum]
MYSSGKSSTTTNPPRSLDSYPSNVAALPPPLSTESPDNFSQRALHLLLTAAFSPPRHLPSLAAIFNQVRYATPYLFARSLQ